LWKKSSSFKGEEDINRSLACLICGTRRNVQAAHIRAGSPAYGKRSTGAGEKSSDMWTLPLCADHHQSQHCLSEMYFWKSHNIDPFAVALALFAASGDDEAADLIVKEAGRKCTP
jgi:hypothetical protein